MFDDSSSSFNSAVVIENDPVFQAQNQQELALSPSSDSQSIEQAAARLAKSVPSVAAAQPDLVITNNTAITTIYTGSQINFTYTIKNQGQASAGASKTYFYLSKDNKLDNSDTLFSSKDSVVSLGAGKSSVESMALTISSTQAPGSYYLLTKADGEGKVSEGYENNNLYAKAITIKQSQPDLILPSVTAPASADAGATITIGYTEKNQGTTSAGSHKTNMYFSKDNKLDSSDVLLGSNNESSLAAGASKNRTKSVKLDSNLASGNYYILFQSDAGKQVAESNENNNIAAKLINIKGSSAKPDLLLTNLSTSPSAAPGTTLNLNYTLKNQGTASASSHQTNFYLSKDAVWDNSDTLLANNGENSLAAGASRSGSKSVTLGSDLAPGSYYLIGLADGQKQITESNENNNALSQAITITGSPDLLFTNVTAPTTGKAGATLNLGYTLKNQGTGAAGLHTTGFYLSKDNVLDSNDLSLSSNAEDGLAAGASRNGTASVDLPTDLTTGTYYLLYSADAEKGIVESNENNNISAKAISITGVPDLLFDKVSVVPENAAPGETILLEYTEKNQGGALADYHFIDFYLSTDDVFDEFDSYIGYNYEDSLAAGGSQDGSFSISLSPTLAEGTYYVFLNISAYADGDLSNNLASQAFTISGSPSLPELTINDFTAPDSATAGDTISIEFSELNQGLGFAGAHYVDIFLSTDNVFDGFAEEYHLFAQYDDDGLSPGESQNYSTSVALNYGLTSGTYYLFFSTDIDGLVAEGDENNNYTSQAIEITGAPPPPPGYDLKWGWGQINAAGAVAKALGQSPFPDVPNLGGNDWGADLVKAPEVWAQGYTGQGVVVAVLDTGVDYTHSDLSDNIWTNAGEIANNGVDDDGNGYTDDVYGWDFAYGTNNTSDIYGHGTHVSGTIAGVKNSFGVTGIAYDAQIMPVKVLDDFGSGSWSGIADGIYYAVNNGADVINMSLGGAFGDSGVQAAIEYASSKGVIVVSAAGNESSFEPSYPGHYATDWGLVAGAVDIDGKLAYFSNYAGSNPNMAYITAPGVDVYSTVPGEGYDYYSGTSMATPHIAGVVALMLSANDSLTDTQVRQYVIETASQTGSLSLKANQATFKLSNSDSPRDILDVPRAMMLS